MIGHYFAYGSNVNPARMRARGISFKGAMGGILPRYELRFNKRASHKNNIAYANIAYARDARDGRVEGVLYQLERANDIEIMDQFEGNPVRYSREVYRIETGSGVVNAWVYVANRAMLAEGLLPERCYLNQLIAGRQYHSDAYSQWLQSHPCVEIDSVEIDSVEVESGLATNGDGLIYNV
ncbi:MAG: gamma-glutamylcyclotransferase family protein [Pseudomonadales bacterium]